MKLHQKITVEGNDMVLTVTRANGKVMGERRWRGAAKYIYATKEFKGGAVFVMAVPVAAKLDIQNGVDLKDWVL